MSACQNLKLLLIGYHAFPQKKHLITFTRSFTYKGSRNFGLSNKKKFTCFCTDIPQICSGKSIRQLHNCFVVNITMFRYATGMDFQNLKSHILKQRKNRCPSFHPTTSDSVARSKVPDKN